MSQTTIEQTLISSDSHKQYRITQDFHILWLDSDIDQINKQDRQLPITELEFMFKTVRAFTDVDKCIDYLTDIKDEHVFMIISGTSGQHIVPLIEEIPKLNALFIFCENESLQQYWIKDCWKIKGVFTEMATLCSALSMSAHQCDQNSVSFGFIPVCNDFSSKNLDELDSSFMYTRILKEILFEIAHNEQSINDFAAHCRSQYVSSSVSTNSIDRFINEYHDHSPIWWYTAPTFIYSMLNRALRTQEIDTIIKMGFFITDLHHNIGKLHIEQFLNQSIQPFTVYRGQGMSKTDFDKMMSATGGLMAFNNFLSTSTDQIIAFRFAGKNSTYSDSVGIMFEITVDPKISSVHFARLDNIGYYKDFEREVLFSMHTVFRIGEIKQIDKSNNRIWQVKLTLTSDDDPQLTALTECMRKMTKGCNGWYRLVEFLSKFGEFDKAEQMSHILLSSSPTTMEKAHIYNALGAIKKGQGEHTNALSFYEKTLLIIEKLKPWNGLSAGRIYSSIGVIYLEMDKYSEALYYMEKGLETLKKMLPFNDPELATSYSNISQLYKQMCDYSKALSYQRKALDIKQKVLPQNHPDLAISYNIMAGLYESMGRYEDCLSFYVKALEIRKKSLPPNHPSMMISYHNIAKACSRLQKHFDAISYLEMAIEICHKSDSSDHSNRYQAYVLAGSIYDDMDQNSEALLYYEKALRIIEKTPRSSQIEEATFYNNIGLVYSKIGNYSKAISFHEKALEIRHRILPPHHPDFGQSYHNIGFMYANMEDYPQALSYYQKALEIKQKTLPPNHPSIVKTRSGITSVLRSLKTSKSTTD